MFVRFLTLILLATSSMLGPGCSSGGKVTIVGPNPSAPEAIEGEKLTVGLIADSQLQTPQALDYSLPFRDPRLDSIVGVSIRPPALERHANLLFDSAFSQVVEADADVVLVLGDVMNNGCRDEWKAARAIMVRHLDSVPIFVVRGNHDYLANGNSSIPEHRQRYCGDAANVMSESEVLEAFAAFNRESAERHSLEYTENSDALRCEDFCYYAGLVRIDGHQVVLTDTSDYRDVGQQDPEFFGALADGVVDEAKKQDAPLIGRISRLSGLYRAFGAAQQAQQLDDVTQGNLSMLRGEDFRIGELAGVRGGVSWEDEGSQIDWLMKQLEEAEPSRIRLIASHFETTALTGAGAARFAPFAGLVAVGKPEQTVWVSAHAHTLSSVQSRTVELDPSWSNLFVLGDQAEFQEFRTGSTTDNPHYGLMQVTATELTAQNVRVTGLRLCERRLMELAKPDESWGELRDLLGISRKYRTLESSEPYATESQKRLMQRVDTAVEDPSERRAYLRCAAAMASYDETF